MFNIPLTQQVPLSPFEIEDFRTGLTIQRRELVNLRNLATVSLRDAIERFETTWKPKTLSVLATTASDTSPIQQVVNREFQFPRRSIEDAVENFLSSDADNVRLFNAFLDGMDRTISRLFAQLDSREILLTKAVPRSVLGIVSDYAKAVHGNRNLRITNASLLIICSFVAVHTCLSGWFALYDPSIFPEIALDMTIVFLFFIYPFPQNWPVFLTLAVAYIVGFMGFVHPKKPPEPEPYFNQSVKVEPTKPVFSAPAFNYRLLKPAERSTRQQIVW